MHAWIVSLILLCAPPDAARQTFDVVADAIEQAASDFAEPGAPRFALAAELVALAARESHFVPWATGYDSKGASFGLFQLHESNMRRLDRVCPPPVYDPATAAELAASMVLASHALCAGRDPSERLGWYASGGAGCDVPAGLAASRNRTALAAWLLRRAPPYWAAPAAWVVEVRRKR